MAIDFAKLQKRRAKGNLARKMFEGMQKQGYGQCGNITYYNADVARYYSNILELDAGYSYIHLGANVPSYATPYPQPSPNIKPECWNYQAGITPSINANDYENLRGYVQFVKLSDYLAANNFVHATRVFRNQTYGNYGTIAGNDGVPVDDRAMFSDYVVPTVSWFYTDSTGGASQYTGNISVYYFFTASQIVYAKYKKLLQTNTYTATKINAGATVNLTLNPPIQNGANVGALLSGYIDTSWNGTGAETRYITLNGNGEYSPYIVLAASRNVPTMGGNKYPIYKTVNVGYEPFDKNFYVGATGTYVCAYKSKQDFIDVYDDLGVFMSDDLDAVINHEPDKTDGVINPDNPDEEIPFYPDNSTDITPIEQAYITPSTFGQTLVYNPTTTRDFLNWICDNTVNIDNWRRLFANPVDVIMGINLYNLDIPAHDTANTKYNENTNILGVTTNIPNYSILGGYNNIVDGGTLTLQAYYGNYADFTSMTYQMFIPFVGFTTLRACDVVNKRLHLFYAVDFATGAAVAFVNSNDKLIYTAPCTVAGKIPVSTSDKNNQIINNTLAAFSSIGGLLGGIASGNVGGGVGALMNGLGSMQMQTNYTNKGSLSAVNIYKLLPAFIERTRYDLFFPTKDQQYLGAKYQSAAGAPSTQFDTLLNCVDAGGFVQSDVVYITSQTATETEKQQIINLIKSGIYL